MDAAREAKLKKILEDALSCFEKPKPSAYERFVDITMKLFYKTDAKVIIVMNRKDFKAISGCTSFANPYRTIEIKENMYCPHGNIAYTILDDTVDAMYGYLLVEKL